MVSNRLRDRPRVSWATCRVRGRRLSYERCGWWRLRGLLLARTESRGRLRRPCRPYSLGSRGQEWAIAGFAEDVGVRPERPTVAPSFTTSATSWATPTSRRRRGICARRRCVWSVRLACSRRRRRAVFPHDSHIRPISSPKRDRLDPRKRLIVKNLSW